MNNKIHDFVIIGGGVAGSTVALYLSRAGYKPIIITKGSIGGKLNEIDTIQNYVGIKDADGEEVAQNISQQLEQSGLEYDKDILIDTDVLEVAQYNVNLWEILIKNDFSDETEKVFAKNVIIATGMEKMKLSQVSDSFQHNCVLCDGFMYKDKEVLVVGGGSSAFTEALELSKLCSRVTILSRSENYRAEQTLIDSIKNSKNIYLTHGEIINGREYDGKKQFSIREDNMEYRLTTDGLFTYIGSKPNNDFLPSYVKKDIFGHIIRDGNKAISEDGVIENMYVVGDITTTTAKQFGIAIGQAISTAIEIIENFK